MNRNINRFATYFGIYAVIFLLFVSCANIVNPSGGPKDTKPPKPIRSIPENYSVHFNKNKIEILFDEFIVLKDIKNQLLISPPFNEMPEVKIKGKTLVIEFNENLKENTTYTLFFGDAIVDLTEANAISSYEYVFSTGSNIDSMTITGKVVDAFTLKPEKDFFVMLYDLTYDSIPYKTKPYYLSKTKENGEYIINNLRNIPYKIFALKDANNNFKFDQIKEKIAFDDSLVIPHQKPVIKIDSTLKDSLHNDSLKTKISVEKNLAFNDLRSFSEIDSTQRLLKAEFVKKGKVLFTFRYPVKNLNISFLNRLENYGWKIEEWNPAKDSLIYWMLKPEIDTLNMIVNDNNQLIDTINIRLKQKTTLAPILDSTTTHTKGKNTKPIPINIPRVYPMCNLSPISDFFTKINISFPNPILNYDSIAILLIEDKDTLITKAVYTDLVHRKFQINKELKQDKEYKLILKQDIITDIFGNSNDSLVVNFKTNTTEDIGNFLLSVNFKDTVNSYIIQLLSENETIIDQRFIKKNTKLIFKHLMPGTYFLKAIKDVNSNKKWDTGNYLKKVQPERVINFQSKITIRANWDLEEIWEL
ncbi:MAG: Ig-like domain-containing protein [Bacteroidales bacterium]